MTSPSLEGFVCRAKLEGRLSRCSEKLDDLGCLNMLVLCRSRRRSTCIDSNWKRRREVEVLSSTNDSEGSHNWTNVRSVVITFVRDYLTIIPIFLETPSDI